MESLPEEISARFEVLNYIGEGAFSTVFEALKAINEGGHIEAFLLSKKLKHKGLPRIYSFFPYKNINYLAIELLGPSFLSLVQLGRAPMSQEFVLRSAYQLIKTLKYIHKRGYIHRDIKPDNLLLGIGRTADQTYLIDFSESRKFKPAAPSEYISGSPYFMSVTSLQGEPDGPRDDIESLVFTLLFCLKGSLPWMHIVEADPDVLKRLILDQKKKTPLRVLFDGCFPELREILESVRSLSWDQLPNYTHILDLLAKAAAREGSDLESKRSASITSGRQKRGSELLPPKASIMFRRSSMNQITIRHQGTFAGLINANRCVNLTRKEEQEVNKDDSMETVVSERLPELPVRILSAVREASRRRLAALVKPSAC